MPLTALWERKYISEAWRNYFDINDETLLTRISLLSYAFFSTHLCESKLKDDFMVFRKAMLNKLLAHQTSISGKHNIGWSLISQVSAPHLVRKDVCR